MGGWWGGAQLGESQVMQAVTKMGDGVQEAEAKPVPHQLRHKYAKVPPPPPPPLWVLHSSHTWPFAA